MALAPSSSQPEVVVVTGGGSGIGRAICKAFAASGAVIAALDIDGAGAQGTVDELGDDGRAHLALPLDVTQPDAVREAVEQIAKRAGRIDVLVNNAGVASTVRFLEQSIESWRRDFAVNVEGPFLMTQAVAAVMMRQDLSARTSCRGKLINVSSPAAEMGRPLVAAYGASKAALNHLSKTSAVVLGEFAIATTVLYPGAVEDGMWNRMPGAISALDGRDPGEIRRAAQAEQVLERFQTAEEVADVAVYIASQVGLALNGSLLWSTPHAAAL
jgi:NAD(P)-dependent dehydrogenase (short-subunit alcohol dehydrogenase family)